MDANKKRVLALATVVSFVISNPITGHAEEIVENLQSNQLENIQNEDKLPEMSEKQIKNYEKDDAYHGTWEKPFIFPSDEDEELDIDNTYVHTNHFSGYGWQGWTKGSGSYGKYASYKESQKNINKGKSGFISKIGRGGGTSS